MDALLSRIDLDEVSSEAKGCAAMAAAGVATHLLYFIRGDHNRYAHRWITRALTGIAALGLVVLHLVQYDFVRAAILTALFTPSYFAGLFTSIGLYRVFLHPLGRFPGPFLARFSNLYHLYIIRKSDNYLVMQKLHAKYGPIVRTGMFFWTAWKQR
jgi:tryprostatin B 6-hydroxylase